MFVFSRTFRFVLAASLTCSALLYVPFTWHWPLVGDASLIHYIAFLIEHWDSIDRALAWLEYQDMNECGLLEIPEEIAIAAHIGVGHRADPWPARLARRPVEDFAFSERYGSPLV